MIIVIDVEATCWDDRPYAENMETIELPAIALSINGKVLSEFQTFIKPQIDPKLSEFCTQLTSITQEQVDSAPFFTEAYDGLIRWLGNQADPSIMASWGDYDVKQLKRDCERNHKRFPFKQHVNLKRKFRMEFLRPQRYEGVSAALVSATQFFGIPFEGRLHRGIDDSRMIVKVYQAMVQHNKPLNNKDIINVS